MVYLQTLEMDLSEDQILNLQAGKELRDVMPVHLALVKTKLLQECIPVGCVPPAH